MHCSRPPARSGGRSSADRAFARHQHALSFAALARHAAPPLRCLALLRRHSDCHGHLFERLRLGLRYVMQRPRRAAARRQRSRSASHSPRASPAGRCRARLRAPWRPQRSGDDWDGDGLSATRPHRVPCAAIGRLGRHSERRAPKKARGHGRSRPGRSDRIPVVGADLYSCERPGRPRRLQRSNSVTRLTAADAARARRQWPHERRCVTD